MTFKRAEEIFKVFIRTKQRVGRCGDSIGETCRALQIGRVELNEAVMRVCER